MSEGSISTETIPAQAQTEMQRKPIQIEVSPKTIDKTTVGRVESALSPEALKENRVHAHGMNVMGEGVGFYDKTPEEKVQEALSDPHKALLENAAVLSLTPESINVLDDDAARALIQTKVKERDEQHIANRKTESVYLEELGVDGAIKIHMSRGPFDSRVVDMDNPNPNQDEAFKYVQEQLAKGRRVQIALGPGIKEYRNPNGEIQENTTTYINKETGKLETSETYFHIPTQPGEIEQWKRYCRFIADKCKGADFDIWVEANHNLDDSGHGNFQHNTDLSRHGEFSSTGRTPAEYAVAVVAASEAVKEIDPKAKVGINLAFVDTDYAIKTLEAIKAMGQNPTYVVDYVSLNPYRFGKKPEDCGPKWNENLAGNRGEHAPKGKFDWTATGSYENEVVEFLEKVGGQGIKDIRIGESGWPKESLTEDERAQYNLRGWILDRYVGLPESPWTLSSESEDFSLVKNNGEKTPTYWAYRNFNKIFISTVRPTGEIQTGDNSVVCKVFEDDNTHDEILVVWQATDYYDKDNSQAGQSQVDLLFDQESDIEIISKLTATETVTETKKAKTIQIGVSGEPIIIRRHKFTTI